MELLVVIAIIGILVSLLLPAVQAAREAARRVQCANHLKQIGLALHNYHESCATLPFGSVYNPGHVPSVPETGTWCSFILPYLEQQNLFDLFDFDVPMDHANNVAANTTVVATWICPSDPEASEPVLDNASLAGGIAPAGNPKLHHRLWYPGSMGPTAPNWCYWTNGGVFAPPDPNNPNPNCQGCS